MVAVSQGEIHGGVGGIHRQEMKFIEEGDELGGWGQLGGKVVRQLGEVSCARDTMGRERFGS